MTTGEIIQLVTGVVLSGVGIYIAWLALRASRQQVQAAFILSMLGHYLHPDTGRAMRRIRSIFDRAVNDTKTQAASRAIADKEFDKSVNAVLKKVLAVYEKDADPKDDFKGFLRQSMVYFFTYHQMLRNRMLDRETIRQNLTKEQADFFLTVLLRVYRAQYPSPDTNLDAMEKFYTEIYPSLQN